MQTQQDLTQSCSSNNQMENKPIAYASRSRTSTKRLFTERAICFRVWAVKHIRTYLWRDKFTLLKDHKPLIYMFNPKTATLITLTSKTRIKATTIWLHKRTRWGERPMYQTQCHNFSYQKLKKISMSNHMWTKDLKQLCMIYKLRHWMTLKAQ